MSPEFDPAAVVDAIPAWLWWMGHGMLAFALAIIAAAIVDRRSRAPSKRVTGGHQNAPKAKKTAPVAILEDQTNLYAKLTNQQSERTLSRGPTFNSGGALAGASDTQTEALLSALQQNGIIDGRQFQTAQQASANYTQRCLSGSAAMFTGTCMTATATPIEPWWEPQPVRTKEERRS